jgi:hypothetical protein
MKVFRGDTSLVAGPQVNAVVRPPVNVFELAAIASPVVGAVSGAMSVKSPGVLATVTGIGAGLIIGLASYVAAIGGSALLARSLNVEASELLSPSQRLASFTAVLLPMLAPFVACGLSVFVIAELLHL